MLKWLLVTNAGGRIENLVYYVGTGIGAGVINVVSLSVVSVTVGHYVAKHPMDVEKEFSVCPFHRVVWRLCGWTKPQLVQVFVVKTSNSTVLSEITTIRSGCGQCHWHFRQMWSSLVIGVMAQQHAGPCAWEKFTALLNGYRYQTCVTALSLQQLQAMVLPHLETLSR